MTELVRGSSPDSRPGRSVVRGKFSQQVKLIAGWLVPALKIAILRTSLDSCLVITVAFFPGHLLRYTIDKP